MRAPALLLLVLALGMPFSRASAQPLDPSDVPAPLAPYVPWVLFGSPHHGCPRVGDVFVCAFPGLLEVERQGNEVRFALEVVVDAETTVGLPGSTDAWPLDVRDGGRPLVVLADEGGMPTTRLSPGAHHVEGVLRYGRPPDAIPVPAGLARIAVVSAGVRSMRPRGDDGQLPLGAVASSEVVDEADSATFEVVRRVVDGVPLRVETHIEARIGGRARTLDLGSVIVTGSVPVAVEASIPVQVSANGSLVLQAVSGTHRIRIAATLADPRAPLAAPRVAPPWPTQEIWLFVPSEELRQVDVRGGSGIDPQTPSIPDDWRSAAAYVLASGATLTLDEARRGESEPPPSTFNLSRRLWLDFDGHGFTGEDTLSGEWHRATRLDLLHGDLGRVEASLGDQLITLPPRGDGRGIELRESTTSLRAELRIDAPASALPAVGWSEDVNSLQMELQLPPGYTLLHASGVDRAIDAWTSRWDVGPIFLVLLVAVAFARLFGRAAGAIAGATLLLVYGEPGAPTFVFLAVLIPFAILRAVREGRFARFVFLVFAASAIALAGFTAAFVAKQLRYVLHPQLVTEDLRGGYDDNQGYGAIAGEDAEGGSGMAMTRSAVMGEAPAAPSSPSAGGRGESEMDLRLENWIDPNAVVQTGYGKMNWQHTGYTLVFNGRVDHDHVVRLRVISPMAQRLLALLRAAGLLALLALLVRGKPAIPPAPKPEPPMTEGGDGGSPGPTEPENTPPAAPRPPSEAETTPTPPSEAQTTAPTTPALTLALALVASMVASHAAAQPTTAELLAGQPALPSTPSEASLAELQRRLLLPPACGAACVRVADARVEARGDDLRIILHAHAGARTALRLPGPADTLVPAGVRVDGQPSNALRRADDGYLLLRLEPGVHEVELVASLGGRATLTLSMPDAPGRVAVAAEGWSVTGLDEHGALRGSLELRRALGATTTRDESATPSVDLPVWVRVDRRLDVGIAWLVQTTVERTSQSGAAAVVRIPALGGETVLGSEAVREGEFLLVNLPQGVPSVRFTSRIAAASNLALSAPASADVGGGVYATFHFVLSCSPLFHCTHEGVPPVAHAIGGHFSPSFAPYPGESLTLHAERLRAAPGRSFTIETATLDLIPGKRSRNGTLGLSVHSSVSNTLRLGLPRGLVVERVTVDGMRRAIEVRDGKLAIGVVPGRHDVSLSFIERTGFAFVTRTPRFTIDGSAVNVTLTIAVPEERWLLFAGGPDWGPVVLFWGHLALVVLLAIVLGRIPRSPLPSYAWGLLAFGLTQAPLPLTFVVVGWFFFVVRQHQREGTGPIYNLLQLALVPYTFATLGILLFVAYVGLNERPDMQIVGNGSYRGQLRFYLDRTEGALPVASFFSLSVWVWKGLMLAWAFWLAASVVKWAVWASAPFREHGFLKSWKRDG